MFCCFESDLLLLQERAVVWEREQEAAQHKQRNELQDQIKQDKELTDDIADRRRRARANAQTKHVGQNARLKKPTKKQVAGTVGCASFLAMCTFLSAV